MKEPHQVARAYFAQRAVRQKGEEERERPHSVRVYTHFIDYDDKSLLSTDFSSHSLAFLEVELAVCVRELCVCPRKSKKKKSRF